MIPCLPEHIDATPCPECGTAHERFSALPDRPLSIAECQELIQGNQIDDILPIFRVHTKEQYQKVTPAIVLIADFTVKILWCNPNTESDWVVAHEKEQVSDPYTVGWELGKGLRESTYQEDEIEGHEVVYPDKELWKVAGVDGEPTD